MGFVGSRRPAGRRVAGIMKYVALLKGINVGGQKKIQMADLKSMFEELGFAEVATYIQSGNVIFDTRPAQAEKLEQKIEAGIEQSFGFEVSVLVRTHEDLDQALTENPFGSMDPEQDGTRVMFTFLSSSPLSENARKVEALVGLPEKLVVKSTLAYLHCPNGYGKTRFSNTWIENRLKVRATTRNWKSVLKLHQLSC